jgi:hypothetical protein
MPLLGCASNPPAGNTTPNGAAAQKTSAVPAIAPTDASKLAKGEMLAVTKTVQKPELLSVTNWSKVRIFSDLLDSFKGHESFTVDQKFALLQHLFAELPINGPDGVAREIAVGKYFENGDPLMIRVGVFTPKAGATTQSKKVIVIMTNVIVLQDKEKGEVPSNKSGLFLNLDMNATVFCGLTDPGLLTNGQKFSPQKGRDYAKIESGSPIERIMAAQSMLADEDIPNDSRVVGFLAPIIADEKEMPAFRIMAMLKMFDYYLSLEDLQSARQQWAKILDLAPSVPGDMTKENLEALNGASLKLMELLLSTKG